MSHRWDLSKTAFRFCLMIVNLIFSTQSNTVTFLNICSEQICINLSTSGRLGHWGGGRCARTPPFWRLSELGHVGLIKIHGVVVCLFVCYLLCISNLNLCCWGVAVSRLVSVQDRKICSALTCVCFCVVRLSVHPSELLLSTISQERVAQYV